MANATYTTPYAKMLACYRTINNGIISKIYVWHNEAMQTLCVEGWNDAAEVKPWKVMDSILLDWSVDELIAEYANANCAALGIKN